MKCLLDAHTVLWLTGNVPRLSEKAKSAILDPTNKKFVSIASAWEIAIKISVGKLKIDGGVMEFFRMVDENGFIFLPIKKEHVEHIQTLPLHHRDPFDRMLVAIAASEGMSLITADENIHLYDISWVW